MLFLVAAGVYGALQGRGDDTDGGGAVPAARPAEDQQRRGGVEEQFEGAGGGDAAATESKNERTLSGLAVARPVFQPRLGNFTSDDLRAFGRIGPLFNQFRTAYTVSDAVDLQDRYLGKLIRLAPDDAAAEQTETCGRTVLESRDEPVLAAYGAHGTMRRNDRGRAALVIGFAYPSGDEGPLDRFMLWVWPRGDCDAPIDYVSAQIRPR
jgi:hypothetical protein